MSSHAPGDRRRPQHPGLDPDRTARAKKSAAQPTGESPQPVPPPPQPVAAPQAAKTPSDQRDSRKQPAPPDLAKSPKQGPDTPPAPATQSRNRPCPIRRRPSPTSPASSSTLPTGANGGPEAGRSAFQRRPPWVPGGRHQQASMGRRSNRRPDASRGFLAPRKASLQPPRHTSLTDVAQCRRTGRPGRRLGRRQRPHPPGHLHRLRRRRNRTGQHRTSRIPDARDEARPNGAALGC